MDRHVTEAQATGAQATGAQATESQGREGPIAEGHQHATPAVRICDLSVRYADGTRALRGVHLTVGCGEVVGLLGPSGSGKTTLQRVVVGLAPPTSGTVEVLGRPVGHWGPELYRRMGVSFELPTHYRKLTGRENLELFAALHRDPTEDPDALLAELGLGDAADSRVASYSKGMAVRLGIARALLHRPDLVVLDEPTAGLDPSNIAIVRRLVNRLHEEGRTVLVATHDMALADAVCDRVAFVRDGRLVALDAPARLRLAAAQRRVRVVSGPAEALQTTVFSLAGIADDPAFLALLRSGQVQTIHTTEATLDEIFRDVTAPGRT